MRPDTSINCGIGAERVADINPTCRKSSKRGNVAQAKTAKHSKRWIATIYHRTNAGLIGIKLQIEELEELQEIIERGPNWYALDRIEVHHTLQKGTETIEQLMAEDHRSYCAPWLSRLRRAPTT